MNICRNGTEAQRQRAAKLYKQKRTPPQIIEEKARCMDCGSETDVYGSPAFCESCMVKEINAQRRTATTK